MPLRRERIGELVQHQSGLMATDSDLAGPKPQTNQIFVLAHRVVPQPIDAAHRAGDTTHLLVVTNQLPRIPGFCRLGQGEIARLASGDLIELIPIWRLHRCKISFYFQADNPC